MSIGGETRTGGVVSFLERADTSQFNASYMNRSTLGAPMSPKRGKFPGRSVAKGKKLQKIHAQYIERIGDEEYAPPTQTVFFHDIRKMLLLDEGKWGGTTGSIWLDMLFWVGLAFYTILAVFEWLNFLDLSYDNPLFYCIVHGVLAVYFFILFLRAVGLFAAESLLREEMTRAVRTFAGVAFNSISGLTFLIWIVMNTTFWDNTDFTKDPEDTVDYRDIMTMSFVLYIIFVCICVICYMVRYNQQKIVEMLSKSIRHLERNGDGHTLRQVLVTGEAFLAPKSVDDMVSDTSMNTMELGGVQRSTISSSSSPKRNSKKTGRGNYSHSRDRTRQRDI